MLHFNYHLPGTAPATLSRKEGDPGKPPVLTLISYNEKDCIEKTVGSLEELQTAMLPGYMHWINVQGLGDTAVLAKLGEMFHLHPLTLEDVLNTSQRPKIEQYEDVLFIVSAMLYFDSESSLTAEQLSIFMAKGFVITLQEEQGQDLFERIRTRIRTGRGMIRKMRSDYLVYAILDAAVDGAFPVLEVLGDGLEDLEADLMEKPTRETLRKLHDVKRLLLQVRRSVWPHREILNALLRDESGLVHRETGVYLRDCYDHVTQLIDMVESYRDLAAGLMDVYLSSIGVRTNEIMRVLTLVSTFFIPLTFLAGVYGMNFNTDSPFNMPELNLRFGYILFWLFCLLLALAMFLFFRRKKWI